VRRPSGTQREAACGGEIGWGAKRGCKPGRRAAGSGAGAVAAAAAGRAARGRGRHRQRVRFQRGGCAPSPARGAGRREAAAARRAAAARGGGARRRRAAAATGVVVGGGRRGDRGGGRGDAGRAARGGHRRRRAAAARWAGPAPVRGGGPGAGSAPCAARGGHRGGIGAGRGGGGAAPARRRGAGAGAAAARGRSRRRAATAARGRGRRRVQWRRGDGGGCGPGGCSNGQRPAWRPSNRPRSASLPSRPAGARLRLAELLGRGLSCSQLPWPAWARHFLRCRFRAKCVASHAERCGKLLSCFQGRLPPVLFQVRYARLGYSRPLRQVPLGKPSPLSQLFKSRVESHFRISPQNTPNGVDNRTPIGILLLVRRLTHYIRKPLEKQETNFDDREQSSFTRSLHPN
jgi:hypothetical protein